MCQQQQKKQQEQPLEEKSSTMVVCEQSEDVVISNIKEGYMFVQSNVVWKPWSMKAKYFILTTECLYCFKRRGDLDAIPYDVIRLDGASVTVADERRGMRKRYYIRLTSPQQRKSFNIFCFVQEERDAWLTSILLALAKKFTDKGFVKRYHEPADKKTMSLLVDTRQHHPLLKNLEESKAMSISCMELTNLSVIPEPHSPIQTAIPIRKTFDLTHIHQKKMSSGSLDIAIRTDVSPLPHNSHRSEISTNTREFYGTLNRTSNTGKSKALTSSFSGRMTSNKRPNSMTNLLTIPDEPSKTYDNVSCHSTPSNKRKRKVKGLSLAFFGGTNSLNFRTASMDNIF